MQKLWMLLFLFFLVAESTLLGSLVPSNATLPTKDLMKQIMVDPKNLLLNFQKSILANYKTLLHC